MLNALTIGVPSFNRPNECLNLVRQIIEEFAGRVRLVVIDDSNDGAVASCLRLHYEESDYFRIIVNGTNQGYSKSLIRLIEECKTPYLMMMADDDLVHPEGIRAALELLGIHHPDFVAPQFLANGAIYRGMDELREISPKEYMSSSRHAPGLIYRVPSVKGVLSILCDRVLKGTAEALVYPQVLIVAALLGLNKRCFWMSVPTAVQGAALGSNIVDDKGSVYWSFDSRWRQLKGFEEFFNQLDSELFDQDRVREMRRMNASQAFAMLIESMRAESPGLSSAFDAQARKSYFKQTVFMILQYFKLGKAKP